MYPPQGRADHRGIGIRKRVARRLVGIEVVGTYAGLNLDFLDNAMLAALRDFLFRIGLADRNGWLLSLVNQLKRFGLSLTLHLVLHLVLRHDKRRHDKGGKQ